jgi:hypothetical protein
MISKIEPMYTTPQKTHYDLAHPQQMSLRRLVGLTRDYHRMSTASVSNSYSNYHRWYYICANECERRGLDLQRIIKQ